MAEFSSPGVRIRELRAGVPQIRGATTSVGAFVGRCLRGPANRAVRVTSFPQFQRIYGTFDPNSYMPDSVKAFFDNGGSECHINRVLGSSGGGAANVKASKQSKNTGQATNVLTVTAVGEGPDGNNFNVLYRNEDNKISSTIPADITVGAKTQISLGVAICAKLQIGDVVLLSDSVGPDTVRIVVSGIANGIVNLQSSVTFPLLSAATTSVTLETFSLTILYAGSIVFGPQTGLRISPLSKKNYFVTRINTNDDEVPVIVTDSSAAQDGTTDFRPVNVDTTNGDALASGDAFTTFADTDFIGSQGAASGFFAFDKVRRIRKIACPGVTGTTTGAVSKALVQYAEGRKDCVAFTSPPQGTTPSNAVAYKANNIGSSSYGVMDYPWIKTLSPITNQIALLPPEGFRMGVCARTDREEGISDAPAGESKGKLVGSLGVELVLSDVDKDLIYPANINPIENIDDVGQCIMGSRTLETGDFNQIHIRRTFIYLEQSLLVGTRFVIFEPNTPETRAKAARAVSAFLEAEWRSGTLTGDELDDAFTVVCNDSNNPDVVVKAQQMFMDVTVNVPQTTENLVINIQQDQRGSARVAT